VPRHPQKLTGFLPGLCQCISRFSIFTTRLSNVGRPLHTGRRIISVRLAACDVDRMPTPSKYILVSLPLRVFDSSDRDDAISALSATVNSDNGTVLPFHIPEFKIGTLDALVQQADELAKLDGGCASVVSRVADSLRSALDGDEDKISQNKAVNDSNGPLPSSFLSPRAISLTLSTEPTDQYLRSFSWNKVRYRSERPLGELIDILQKAISPFILLSSHSHADGYIGSRQYR
jgi:hypothetical protein